MISTIQELFDHHLSHTLPRFAEHELTLVGEWGKGNSHWYMANPGTGIYSMNLVFASDKIVLFGDCMPFHNGAVSPFGYGPDWFSRGHGWDYLCEKFLDYEFQVDLAVLLLREWIVEEIAGDSAQGEAGSIVDRIASLKEFTDFDMQELEELGLDFSDGAPGYYYNVRHAAMLSAIQHAFARLYAERTEEVTV